MKKIYLVGLASLFFGTACAQALPSAVGASSFNDAAVSSGHDSAGGLTEATFSADEFSVTSAEIKADTVASEVSRADTGTADAVASKKSSVRGDRPHLSSTAR